MCLKLLFFVFTNLIQIKKKTYLPKQQFLFLVMPFMKTYICIVLTNGMFSWYTFSYDRHKNWVTSLFRVLRKRKLLPAWFSVKICCVACAINRTGKLIYLCACLHEHNCAGLYHKPELAPKVSPRPPFNFGNKTKMAVACKTSFLKIRYFERLSKSLKKLTIFFPWNPGPFNRQDYQKQKGPGSSDQLLFSLQSSV